MIPRGWDSVSYRRLSSWVEFLDFQDPQLQISGRKEPSSRFWGCQEATHTEVEAKANLPFTFLLLGRASSGDDLLLVIRLGGIFLS